MNKRERGALSISEEGIVCAHRRLVKDVACAGNAHGGRAGDQKRGQECWGDGG